MRLSFMPRRPVALRGICLTVLALSCQAVAGEVPAPSTLTPETYARWRDFILPSPKEMAFFDIPWQTRLWDGVAEAQKRKRPVLFFSMTGHPCGMT